MATKQRYLTRQFMIRLPPNFYESLRQAALIDDQTLAEFGRDALRRHVLRVLRDHKRRTSETQEPNEPQAPAA